MARKRLLLLLKPFEAFPHNSSSAINAAISSNPKVSQVLNYRDNRVKVHQDAINFCKDLLSKKKIEYTTFMRSTLSKPIRDVDLVVSIGGDGTLLQASHFMDDTIPVLGVNSDPTKPEEVEEFKDEFDASRSTGYLCASTVGNFEQMIDDIFEGHTVPSRLSRMSVTVNTELLPKYALNDVLIAHPNPATLSRFSLRIREGGQSYSPRVNCRSSGLRVSTATGSTAAMLSSGGYRMPVLSENLQYIVREPNLTGSSKRSQMHGLVKPDESMEVSWFCKRGSIFLDGSHVVHPLQLGDTIELTSNAPVLNVFLPIHSHEETTEDQ